MKLENLPIWPRILAAKPMTCRAGRPINILRAVLAAGGLHQPWPIAKTSDWKTFYSGLQLVDLYSTGQPSLPSRRQFAGSHCFWKPRSERFTDWQRAQLRAKADPKFRRAQERARAAAKLVQDLVLHIAARYHATVRPLYRSKYAGIVWSNGTHDNVEWNRYAKSYKFPCKYTDAGAKQLVASEWYGSGPAPIAISPVGGSTIYLPPVPATLQRAWARTEPHPVGLFAVPVKGQPGVFACMSAQPGDRKWSVAGFCVRGRLVPECVARGTTTLADIQAEQNSESRQIMIERFGADRYIRETGATEIDHSDLGTLYDVVGMKVVKVVNSTPEPDGTYKDYFLRVPPNMTTAAEAVAWTFGLKPEEYQPAAQS